jgi:hypothetical protein
MVERFEGRLVAFSWRVEAIEPAHIPEVDAPRPDSTCEKQSDTLRGSGAMQGRYMPRDRASSRCILKKIVHLHLHMS